MAAQAMPVLDQEQLLTRQDITAYHFVMAKRMVARHRYDDWIFLDFHSLDIAKFEGMATSKMSSSPPASLSSRTGVGASRTYSLSFGSAVPRCDSSEGRTYGPTVGITPNRSGPDNGSCALWANPTSSSASPSRRWARVAISFPKGVSITWRWLRSNSVTPSRASSSLIPPLSVDCVTAQLSAARPKWHCSARAHRKRSC